jgi:hypothetical protein
LRATSQTAAVLAELNPGGGDDAFKAKIADAILHDHKELMEKGAKPAAPAPAPLPTVVNTTPAGGEIRGASLSSAVAWHCLAVGLRHTLLYTSKSSRPQI